jgi:hypothetical protein
LDFPFFWGVSFWLFWLLLLDRKKQKKPVGDIWICLSFQHLVLFSDDRWFHNLKGSNSSKLSIFKKKK